MPRNVRNFWGELRPTDRTIQRPYETGPRSKDGGLSVRFRVRSCGAISPDTFAFIGTASADGQTLSVTVHTPKGTEVFTYQR